ncbi:MAG: hypothetical protein ABI629_04130 [bacterium]
MLGTHLALILPDDVGSQREQVGRERPAEHLMIAVLQQARADLDLPAQSLPRLDALRWLNSDDERWPMSFARICRHFGIDPDAGRLALLTSLRP